MKVNIKSFYNSIIDKYLPEQKIISELYFDDELQRLKNGVNILEFEKNASEFEAGNSKIEVFESIKLLLSIYNTLKKSNPAASNEIDAIWYKEMIDVGLEKLLIEKIQKDNSIEQYV